MSTNPVYGTMTDEQIAEAQAAARAYTRAEAIVVLARAIMLASIQGDGLALGYEGAPQEENKSADEYNARTVRASFATAQEFYRLAAETLRGAGES